MPNVRVALVLWAICVGSEAQAQRADPILSENYQSWLLTCQPAIQANGNFSRVCEVNQTIRQAEDGQPILAISLKSKVDPGEPGGLILAPLGLDLWMGIYLEIDDYWSPNIGYNTCLSIGCVGMFYVDDPLLEHLHRGENAALSLYQLDVEEPLRIPISLAGFDAAWKRLEELTR